MSLRNTIQTIIRDKGLAILQKTTFIGVMDDYGAFAGELPAVREVFRNMARNGYFVKVASMSSCDLSWVFEMKSIIFEVSNNYGFQQDMVANILKEVAYGIKLISAEKEWNGIAAGVTQSTPIPSASPSATTTRTAPVPPVVTAPSAPTVQTVKKKSFLEMLVAAISDRLLTKKYIDRKTGQLFPKFDSLSLSVKVPEFERKAGADSPIANYLLGLMYFEGKGVKNDDRKAFGYFETSANLGCAHAVNMLGQCYELGRGASPDTDEAAQWYFKASSMKLRLAMRNLGMLYHKIGNEQEALLWLRKAGDKGDAEAVFQMAEIYYCGKPGVKSLKEALRHYSAGSVMGHVMSSYMTGMLISKGEGIERNYALAVHYLKKAANRGYVEAQYQLGDMIWDEYEKDEYHAPEKMKEEALHWLEKAKSNGHKGAERLFNYIT